MKYINTTLKIAAMVSILGLLAVSGAMAGERLVTGTVIKTDQGVTLLTEPAADRLKVEGADLSNLVGKTVEVVGTVEDSSMGKDINVQKVEVIDISAP